MVLSVEKPGDAGGVAIVTVPGEYLDASVAEEFKRDAAPVLDANPRAVFDLSRLQFIDSAGVGALLSCLRRVSAANGDLKLCGLSPAVRAVFDLARMHRLFDIFPTREEAVAAFNNSDSEQRDA